MLYGAAVGVDNGTVRPWVSSSSLTSASSLDVGLGTQKVLVGNSLCICWHVDEKARSGGAWSASNVGCNACLSVIVSLVDIFPLFRLNGQTFRLFYTLLYTFQLGSGDVKVAQMMRWFHRIVDIDAKHRTSTEQPR